MKLWRYGHTIERLGQRYRLDGMLGSGGMAEVCLAWDEREQREVALKVLKSDDLDQDTLNRFMKEAGQIVDWQHPHILRIYEQMQIELVDVAQGSVLFYIAMEYARGGDLQKRLTPGKPFPLSASFALFRQLCDAVEYAHTHGVIHRDLKPLNILFRRPAQGPEEVVLSDFGLAVQADASHHTFARGGTLAYMAPEQLQGHAMPASDIFALGVILYQLCTGRLPFRRTIHDLMWVNELPTPTQPHLLNPELPIGLDEPILQALRELPAERYHSAREFWDTIYLALLSNARTFPKLADEQWSQAGTTWPFEGLELSPRVAKPLAAVEEPMQEGPEFAPGSLREKQKASPGRSFGLSLPAHS
ncbi:MAG: serine/threonine-protein kinase, partial [Ktedonobacteraceae bacterium]